MKIDPVIHLRSRKSIGGCNCMLCGLNRDAQRLLDDINYHQGVIDYTRAIMNAKSRFKSRDRINFLFFYHGSRNTISYQVLDSLKENFSNNQLRKLISKKIKIVEELTKEYIKVRDGIVRLQNLVNLPL